MMTWQMLRCQKMGVAPKLTRIGAPGIRKSGEEVIAKTQPVSCNLSVMASSGNRISLHMLDTSAFRLHALQMYLT